jgi:hypothetical protein
MNDVTLNFCCGTYTAVNDMGTDTPFISHTNYPFYVFEPDGTYKIFFGDNKRTGKWWTKDDLFFIQLENSKAYQFSYQEEERESENSLAFVFTLRLQRANHVNQMTFKQDIREIYNR